MESETKVRQWLKNHGLEPNENLSSIWRILYANLTKEKICRDSGDIIKYQVDFKVAPEVWEQNHSRILNRLKIMAIGHCLHRKYTDEDIYGDFEALIPKHPDLMLLFPDQVDFKDFPLPLPDLEYLKLIFFKDSHKMGKDNKRVPQNSVYFVPKYQAVYDAYLNKDLLNCELIPEKNRENLFIFSRMIYYISCQVWPELKKKKEINSSRSKYEWTVFYHVLGIYQTIRNNLALDGVMIPGEKERIFSQLVNLVNDKINKFYQEKLFNNPEIDNQFEKICYWFVGIPGIIPLNLKLTKKQSEIVESKWGVKEGYFRATYTPVKVFANLVKEHKSFTASYTCYPRKRWKPREIERAIKNSLSGVKIGYKLRVVNGKLHFGCKDKEDATLLSTLLTWMWYQRGDNYMCLRC